MTDGPAETGEPSGNPPERDYRVFWADEVADEILARDPDEPIVIKGAVSPSGVPHIGHLNEIMRGYYVAEVLRDRGYAVRQVFTSDDRDALRSIPRRLADAEWNLVDLGDVDAGALGRNLGMPYTDIPDPFGDGHDSYGDHFTALLRESADLVGVPVEFLSVTELYADGAFDDVVRTVLECRDRARDVLSRHQAGVDDDYVPFMPQCGECGRLTTAVTAVNLDDGTVEYTCGGLEAGGQEIDGCGHRGTATFREGKLPWRFEWPAEWGVLGVDFEPFGKDHAEGSWPSGQDIAREILEIEPPVPMTYEWFTLNGEALSSSAGNVVTVPELLALIEPEVLRYFFAKSPRKQRDLDLSRIDRIVDEFDRFERRYFGETDAEADERRLAERAYPFVVRAIPVVERLLEAAGVATDEEWTTETYDRLEAVLDEQFRDRVRLAYTFAAVLGMTDDRDLRLDMARREDHIGDGTPDWAIDAALERVERARRWAEREDNQYNYRVQPALPDVSLDDETGEALDAIADTIAAGADGEAIQGAIYETAEAHGLAAGELFAAGYQLFLGQPTGPRLGPFLAALDREFVVDRLRREG